LLSIFTSVTLVANDLIKKTAVIWILRIGIYYTYSKTRLTESVFPLIPNLILTLTLKHNNLFGLTKYRHFSSKCTDPQVLTIMILPCRFLLRLHWNIPGTKTTVKRVKWLANLLTSEMQKSILLKHHQSEKKTKKTEN